VNPITASNDGRSYGQLAPVGLHRAAGENLIHGAASPRGLNNARPPLPTNYQGGQQNYQYNMQHPMQTPTSNYQMNYGAQQQKGNYGSYLY